MNPDAGTTHRSLADIRAYRDRQAALARAGRAKRQNWSALAAQGGVRTRSVETAVVPLLW